MASEELVRMYQALRGDYDAARGRQSLDVRNGQGDLYPALNAMPAVTAGGTRYLRDCGVVMIARTVTELRGAYDFLEGFGDDNAFDEYLNDPTELDHGERLAKFAGQLCYMALSSGKSTPNADAPRYFRNIKEQKHGSVVEHPDYTFLWYGLSRSMTHEAVRHRLASFSQCSQRYVGGNVLRFVERPEFQGNERLHARFERKVDADAAYYEETCDALLALDPTVNPLLSAEKKTEARKRVRQCARESLPNCAEAPMVVTMNARSWRHFLDMRADAPAEVEIRRLAWKTFLCLAQVDAMLWEDFAPNVLPDGTWGAKAEFRKV